LKDTARRCVSESGDATASVGRWLVCYWRQLYSNINGTPSRLA